MTRRSTNPRTETLAARPALIGLLTTALSLGAACKQDAPSSTQPAQQDETAKAASAKPKGKNDKPAGHADKAKSAAKPKFVPLEWDDPASWKRVEPSSRMRRASYEIPAAAGDDQPAELNVFILGGDIEPNIQRWVNEFSNFDVKDVVRVDRSVNDVQQAVVELPKGDFSGGMGSLEGGKGYGLLGAIAVAPSGAKYFFKMTGPGKTVTAARKAFYELLDSIRVGVAKPAGKGAAGPGKRPKTGHPKKQPATAREPGATAPAAKH